MEFTPRIQHTFVHENEAKLNEVKVNFKIKISFINEAPIGTEIEHVKLK